MSKLREAHALLSEHGIGASSYRNPNTGCYCSIGALNEAYSGDCDDPYRDLNLSTDDITDLEYDRLHAERSREYLDDLILLHWAITGETVQAESGLNDRSRVRTLIEEWNDGQFQQAWQAGMAAALLAEDWRQTANAQAAERVLAVWDRALQRQEARDE